MGDVYWGLHLPLASIARRSGIDRAIETGTYFAGGALHLAAMFSHVWTIERDVRLHALSVSRYSELVPNVTWVLGDSASELDVVLSGSDEPWLFFLDAHWFPTDVLGSGAETSHCSLMAELEAIGRHTTCGAGSVILVDDADMFLGSLPPQFERRDFPSIVEIVDFMRGPLRAGCVEVLDDVIVAGPRALADEIAEYRAAASEMGGPDSKRLRVG